MPDHLEDCILPVPDQTGCEAVRALYGACPDHDGFCAPGCPTANPNPKEGM